MDVRDILLILNTLSIVCAWFYQAGAVRETIRSHTELIKDLTSKLETLDSRVAQTREDVSEIQRGE